MAEQKNGVGTHVAELFNELSSLNQQKEEIEVKIKEVQNKLIDYSNQVNLLAMLGLDNTSKGKRGSNKKATAADPEAPYGRKGDGTPKKAPGRPKAQA